MQRLGMQCCLCEHCVSPCEPVQRLDGQWAVSAAARKSEHICAKTRYAVLSV